MRGSRNRGGSFSRLRWSFEHGWSREVDHGRGGVGSPPRGEPRRKAVVCRSLIRERERN